MKKNILIAGASGSIGKEFSRFYSDDPNVEKIVFDWFLEQRSLRICVGVFSLKIKMNEVIKTLNEQKKFNINFIHILTNN